LFVLLDIMKIKTIFASSVIYEHIIRIIPNNEGDLFIIFDDQNLRLTTKLEQRDLESMDDDLENKNKEFGISEGDKRLNKKFYKK